MRSRFLGRRAIFVAAVVVVVVAVGVVGWLRHRAEQPSADGPLGPGDGSGWAEGWCNTVKAVGRPTSFGDFVVPNTSTRALIIDSITVHTSRTAHYLGAYVLPVEHMADGSTLGVGRTLSYRPDRVRAQRVPGAVIPPRHPGGDIEDQAYSYVLGVERTGAAPAEFSGIVIRYHDTSGKRYYFDLSGHGYLVADDCRLHKHLA